MADNVIANTSDAGGATFATDDVAGVHYPRSKVVWGPDGTANDTDVASGKPMPVQLRASAGTDMIGQKAMAASVPVVVASDQSALDVTSNSANIATETTAATIAGDTTSIDGKITACNTGAVVVSGFPDNEPFDVAQYGGVAVGAGNAVHVQPGTSATFQVQSNSANIATETTASTIAGDTTSLDTKIPAQGQALMAASVPVAIASNQSAVQVESNSAAIATQATAATIAGDTTSLDGKIPSQGQAVSASSVPVVVASDQSDIDVVIKTPNGDSAMDDTNDAVKVNIVAGGGSGGTAMADDGAFTVGSTNLTPVGGTYKSVRDSVDDNDAGAFAMTATRALMTTIETPNGDSAMDDTNDAVKVNIVAGGGSGGTAMADDGAFTAGSTNITPVGGVYQSARDAVNDGDAGAIAMTANRVLLTAMETPNGDSCMDDTNDALKVNVVAGAAGSTQYAEDTAASAGETVTMAGVVRADTAASLVGTDGDRTELIVDASGRLHANVGNTVQVQSNSANLATETTASTIAGDTTTIAGDTTSIDGKITACNTGAVTISVFPDNEPFNCNQIGGVAIDAGAGNAGTGTQRVVLASDQASVTIDQATASNLNAEVQGDAAHGAAIAGNPVRIGARAGTADPASVDNGDAVDILATLGGKVVTSPYSIPENVVSGATAAITNTTSTSVIAAGGAGIRNYITSVLVTNSHATVGTTVDITDGSGGTVLYRGYAAEDGGGFSVTLPVPLRTTAATALHAVCGTTGSNVYVSAAGFRAP